MGALIHLEQALDIRRATDTLSVGGGALLLTNIGAAKRGNKEFGNAVKFFSEGLQILEEAGKLYSAQGVRLLSMLAEAEQASGKKAASVEHARRAAQIQKIIKSRAKKA